MREILDVTVVLMDDGLSSTAIMPAEIFHWLVHRFDLCDGTGIVDDVVFAFMTEPEEISAVCQFASLIDVARVNIAVKRDVLRPVAFHDGIGIAIV